MSDSRFVPEPETCRVVLNRKHAIALSWLGEAHQRQVGDVLHDLLIREIQAVLHIGPELAHRALTDPSTSLGFEESDDDVSGNGHSKPKPILISMAPFGSPPRPPAESENTSPSRLVGESINGNGVDEEPDALAALTALLDETLAEGEADEEDLETWDGAGPAAEVAQMGPIARSLAEEFHQVADQLDNSTEGVELSDRQHAGMWLLLHGRRAAENIPQGMPERVRKLIVAALSEGLTW